VSSGEGKRKPDPSFGFINALPPPMSFLKKIIRTGKYRKGDVNKQNAMNWIVMAGLLCLLYWMMVLVPKTFIHFRIVLGIVFIPALILIPFFYKSILLVCGYRLPSMQEPMKYNIVILFAAYLLMAMSVGNFSVTAFLLGNKLLASDTIEVEILQPINLGESGSGDERYSHFEVRYDGVSKKINLGKTPLEAIRGKMLRVEISKGFFGYPEIRSYHLQ
jgi:hypothetical protein